MNESTHLNNALKQAMASLKVLKFDDFWGFSSVAKLKGNETPGKNSHGLLCEG